MIFLDADVLIDALHGAAPVGTVLQKLVDQGHRFSATSITAGELIHGAEAGPKPRQDRRDVENLLGRLRVVPFTLDEARRFGELAGHMRRAGRTVPTVDAMVAAVVLEHGGRFVTRNVRHFAHVPGLELVELDDEHEGDPGDR